MFGKPNLSSFPRAHVKVDEWIKPTNNKKITNLNQCLQWKNPILLEDKDNPGAFFTDVYMTSLFKQYFSPLTESHPHSITFSVIDDNFIPLITQSLWVSMDTSYFVDWARIKAINISNLFYLLEYQTLDSLTFFMLFCSTR